MWGVSATRPAAIAMWMRHRWRSEMMDATTAHRIFEWIERYPPKVVDITGGAPELSAFFQPLVKVSRGAGCRVIDRNNLTILGAWFREPP